jgi:hypothetical protein
VHKLGFFERSTSVTLAGRDHVTVQMDLSRIPETSGERVVIERPIEPSAQRQPERIAPARSQTPIWVGWAATGTLAVSAGVFGYLGVTKANQLESMRNDYGVTRSELESTRNTAHTLLVISDVTAASALVLGGVSLYLTLTGGERTPTQRADQRAHVALTLGPSNVGLLSSF